MIERRELTPDEDSLINLLRQYNHCSEQRKPLIKKEIDDTINDLTECED